MLLCSAGRVTGGSLVSGGLGRMAGMSGARLQQTLLASEFQGQSRRGKVLFKSRLAVYCCHPIGQSKSCGPIQSQCGRV